MEKLENALLVLFQNLQANVFPLYKVFSSGQVSGPVTWKTLRLMLAFAHMHMSRLKPYEASVTLFCWRLHVLAVNPCT